MPIKPVKLAQKYSQLRFIRACARRFFETQAEIRGEPFTMNDWIEMLPTHLRDKAWRLKRSEENVRRSGSNG